MIIWCSAGSRKQILAELGSSHFVACSTKHTLKIYHTNLIQAKVSLRTTQQFHEVLHDGKRVWPEAVVLFYFETPCPASCPVSGVPPLSPVLLLTLCVPGVLLDFKLYWSTDIYLYIR